MFIILYFIYKLFYKIFFYVLPEEWSVKIISEYNNKYYILKKNSNEYYADPFVYKIFDKIYLVYETYDKINKTGRISLCIFNSQLRLIEKIQSLININTHCSYPFILELHDNIYMIPETSKNKTLSVWVFDKEKKFNFLKDILIDVELVDTNVYLIDNLLYYVSTDIRDSYNTIYFITDLDFNVINFPLKFNEILKFRNAGVIYDNINLKITQNRTANYYGTNIIFNTIDFSKNIISPNNVEYNLIVLNKYFGVHHFVKNKDLITFDFKYHKR